MKNLTALIFLAAAAAASAQVKVSELPAASALSGTEVFPGVQSAATKKVSAAQISTYTLGQAAGTYAPINNPTFTGSAGTIPAGWTIGGYLTSASAASTYLTQTDAGTLYQPKTSKLTAFSALTDAAGAFVSDGAGNYSWLAYASTGLSTDAAKLVQYSTGGSILANNTVRVQNGTAYFGITSNGISASKSGFTFFCNLPGSLTGARTITFPDASGALYVAGGALGTPASGTLTNATGLPVATGISGLGTGVATALAVNTGSTGALVVQNGAGGTPSSLTLTSATGLPISTGLTGAGTGVLTALGVNIGSAGAPVLFNGAGGTPSSITLTNGTGLPIAGLNGLGTGVATFLGTPSFANFNAATTGDDAAGVGASNTFTANGALSAPGMTLNGTWIATGGTATTTKPFLLIETIGATSTNWSTVGTGLGINAVTGFAGNMLDVQIDGTRYLSVGSSVINLRSAEIRVCNNSPLYFGPTSSMDIGMFRVSGSALALGGVGGATQWRVVGNGGGSGSSMWISLGHDGTNGVITTGSTGGNISVAKSLSIPSGTGARAGNATLVGGTVTVANTTVTASTLVFVSRKTSGGTVGTMTYTVSAGVSFTLTSSSGTDTSVISYFLIENP